jgi:hypothetical protein
MSLGFWKLTGENADTSEEFTIPKAKFTYTVKFDFRGNSGPDETGSYDMKTMRFGVKQTTRPNPIIAYTEVNRYGLRTKVATRMDYGQFNISFYDDQDNMAHNIFKNYIEKLSPISKLPKASADGLADNDKAVGIGPLDKEYGIIQAVTLVHHGWKQNTIYEYLNPKIVTVTLDELDMSVSDPSSISFTFNCDSVHTRYEAGTGAAANK